METSRDSSVWRNLAVTFGGGLALGAVGMRLTQTALRPVEVTPRPDTNPVADRLNRVERRLERIEQVPAPAASAAATQTAGAQIDQKVLEAIVGAVDARLHEHAGHVERRVADLEARIAVEWQELHQQDRHIAEATEKGLADTQRQFRQEMGELRTALEHDLRQFVEAIPKTVADYVATQVEPHRQDQRIAELQQEFRQEVANLRTAMEGELRTSQAASQAELQELRQQHLRTVDSTEQRFADMRYEYRQEAAGLRTALEGDLGRIGETVSAVVASQAASQGELQELHQQHLQLKEATEQHIGALRHQVSQETLDLRRELNEELGQFGEAVSQSVTDQVNTRAAVLEQSIETRIVTAAAAAAAAQFEERLSPLRAEVRHKERELAELRHRLAESERGVLDVILAIGEVCRQAAGRIGGPPEPRASAPQSQAEAEAEAPPPECPVPPMQEASAISPEVLASPAHVQPEEATLSTADPAPAPAPAVGTLPLPELAADPALAQAIPDFLQDANRTRPWRIPLVSSFLVTTGLMTTGCLLLMHYL